MRLFGHPVHPMLVHFPIAFWTLATGAYIVAAMGFGGATAATAKMANGAGLVMAIPAIAAGLLELRTIDTNSRSFRVATSHMMIMMSAWTLFLFALLLPMAPSLDARLARQAAAGVAVLGFLLLSIGGWLGGRLVYEFGTGVAHLPRSTTASGSNQS